ncbi:MAG: hypothetical protein GXX09_02015 [Syntrophomonadaceae bacterium]|nr:hypothetical protein [Syntrophomonadaceae bacterium]
MGNPIFGAVIRAFIEHRVRCPRCGHYVWIKKKGQEIVCSKCRNKFTL